MIYVSDWIIHAHATKEEDFKKDHKALQEKIYACAKEMGCEDRIEYFKEINAHGESRDYEEAMHAQFIEPYEDNVFWDDLAEYLAERDLINTVGVDELYKLEPIRRISLLEEAQEKYHNEFYEYGVLRLMIDESLKPQIQSKPQLQHHHHHHGDGCCDHDHH